MKATKPRFCRSFHRKRKKITFSFTGLSPHLPTGEFLGLAKIGWLLRVMERSRSFHKPLKQLLWWVVLSCHPYNMNMNMAYIYSIHYQKWYQRRSLQWAVWEEVFAECEMTSSLDDKSKIKHMEKQNSWNHNNGTHVSCILHEFVESNPFCAILMKFAKQNDRRALFLVLNI